MFSAPVILPVVAGGVLLAVLFAVFLVPLVALGEWIEARLTGASASAARGMAARMAAIFVCTICGLTIDGVGIAGFVWAVEKWA